MNLVNYVNPNSTHNQKTFQGSFLQDQIHKDIKQIIERIQEKQGHPSNNVWESTSDIITITKLWEILQGRQLHTITIKTGTTIPKSVTVNNLGKCYPGSH